MIQSNFQNPYNILSLFFNNEDMAKKADQEFLNRPARWGPVVIQGKGEFSFYMGSSGSSDYVIHNELFYKSFKCNNFQEALKEAYEIVKDFCKERKIAPPPHII